MRKIIRQNGPPKQAFTHFPGSKKRLLADFIIGSHALAHADRFMTLDAKRYARDLRRKVV
jgi:predicted nucleic acid-binding protein